jgi:hypothetical protein
MSDREFQPGSQPQQWYPLAPGPSVPAGKVREPLREIEELTQRIAQLEARISSLEGKKL